MGPTVMNSFSSTLFCLDFLRFDFSSASEILAFPRVEGLLLCFVGPLLIQVAEPPCCQVKIFGGVLNLQWRRWVQQLLLLQGVYCTEEVGHGLVVVLR